MPLGSGQTISQPYIVARMTEPARPRDGWRDARTLEVGTGSGYQAAILAELGAEVTSIERHEGLAAKRAPPEEAGYAMTALSATAPKAGRRVRRIGPSWSPPGGHRCRSRCWSSSIGLEVGW